MKKNNITKAIMIVATTRELVDLMDTNGDGRLSLKEMMNAPIGVKLEVIQKYIIPAASFILARFL